MAGTVLSYNFALEMDAPGSNEKYMETLHSIAGGKISFLISKYYDVPVQGTPERRIAFSKMKMDPVTFRFYIQGEKNPWIVWAMNMLDRSSTTDDKRDLTVKYYSNGDPNDILWSYTLVNAVPIKWSMEHVQIAAAAFLPTMSLTVIYENWSWDIKPKSQS